MRFAWLEEPPFNFADKGGALRGHDVEIARVVADALGTAFEPVEAQFAELLPGLADGRWDMTTGMFATPQRARVAAFSRPIWALGDGLLVGAGNPLGIAGYRSLARTGARLAVVRDQQQGTTALQCGIAPAQITTVEDYSAAASAVLKGRADAFASVGRAHVGYLERGATGLAMVPVPSSEKAPEAGAFALPLHAPARLEAVNAALTAFLGGSEHHAIAARYGFSAQEAEYVASRV